MKMNWSHRIIIGGLPRSGSTLFRLILNSTEHIICPAETSFFLRTLENKRKNIDRVAPYLNSKLDINTDAIERCILESKNSLEVMDKLMLLIKNKTHSSKNIWAEKSPKNCFSYKELEEQDKNLFFISTVRDGRDVVTSKGRNDNKLYQCSIDRYVQTMNAVLNFKSEKHKIVKYEEMTRNPTKVLSEIHEWIGIPFDSQCVLNYAENVSSESIEDHKQDLLNGPITDSQINRWEKPEYSDRIKEFMNNKDAVRLLQSSGYKI